MIKCKWVCKRKPGRYKARLIATGLMQSPFDYSETYAPVCKLTTPRPMVAVAAEQHRKNLRGPFLLRLK